MGKRTGNEDPLDSRSVFQPKNSKNTNDLNLNDKSIPQSSEEILDYLSSTDKNFSQETFIDGSKNAYKMIVENYASGSLELIEGFISKEVYDGFSEAISSREKLQQKLHNEVVEFNSVEIVDAILETNIIQLKVMFEAKMISYGEDSTGNVIEGNKDSPQVIKDVWIFQRPIKSKTPAWELISTNPDD